MSINQDFNKIKKDYINKLFDSKYADEKRKYDDNSYRKFFLKYKDDIMKINDKDKDKDLSKKNLKKIDEINIQKLLLTEFKIQTVELKDTNEGKKKNKVKFAEQNTKVIRDKITDLYKKYIIIKYIYDTDDTIYKTYIKNNSIDKDKLFITLNENNSIATIDNYNYNPVRSTTTSGRSSASGVRNKDSINYVYFLDKEERDVTKSNNNQFLLIWNYNIYSIKNIAYNGQLKIKGKFHLNYIYIYILYRIFYYFLNICINLTNNLKKVNYSDLYDTETVDKIIKEIKKWDSIYIYNANYITDKQTDEEKVGAKDNNFETILELYNEFFTKLIQKILSDEALDIDVKIFLQKAQQDRAKVAKEFIKDCEKADTTGNKSNMIIVFLTLLYDNIVAKLKKNNTADYDKAIEIYNIYRSICAYKDDKLEKLENIIRDAEILNEHKEALTISN